MGEIHIDGHQFGTTQKLTDGCGKVQVGEIDIDSELVAETQKLDGTDASTVMMLNNGCLCCTVRDDLIVALTALVRRPCTASTAQHTLTTALQRPLTPFIDMHWLHATMACKGRSPFDAKFTLFCPFLIEF